MKCIKLCVLCLIYFIWTVTGREINLKQEKISRQERSPKQEKSLKLEIKSLTEQIETIKSQYLADVAQMKKEISDLRQNSLQICTDNHGRNEKETLEWAKNSMKEIRMEMRELSRNVDGSTLLQQLHTIRNELKRALSDSKDLTGLARTQEARVDKLDGEVGTLKVEDQHMRSTIAHLRIHLGKLTKELKAKVLEETNSYNEVLEPHEIRAGQLKSQRGHKYRHNKMVHAQISRLARSQDQLDEYQQNLQEQMLDIQKRLDRVEEPNWNLVTAKVDLLQIETKSLRSELKNTTQKISDFDKVHASMLELREDVESIENKADKTIPEFRKEISKLDVSFAQLNAQSSYLKEDQEHLRQSVKAIAVSVSNTIDRAEMDRLVIKTINDSISDLEMKSKQHYYRLNDHILKSEANHLKKLTNETDASFNELMTEVKDLQPIEREYEDLVGQLPKDCSNVTGPPDTYLIHPGNYPIETHCDKGSTLLQRRYNGTVEFNRKYAEYVRGFGDVNSEYWIGLESMHQLTADNCSSMRIDLTDIYGSAWYGEYKIFTVGSGDSGYVLNVDGYKGNASDAFEYQNHMEFSAIDHDRDISNTHCAANYEGGWWFSHCQHVNINGKYNLGLTWFDSGRNEWIAIATSEMRMFRRPGCS